MQVWIGRNGERFGPYTDDEIRGWLRDGTCQPEELGWHEGLTDWRPLGEIFPDDRPAPGSVPPVAPVPPVPPEPPFAAATPAPSPFLGVNEVAEPDYAGFWLRVGAWVIDYLILMVPFTVIGMAMGMGDAMTALFAHMETDQASAIEAYAIAVKPISYVLIVIGFAYYAFFESSKWQATPGKLAVGIRVTDSVGARLTIGRAAARNAVRLVNAVSFLVPFVFYITAAFTQRKQGVHDLLASTYVLVGRVDKVSAPTPRSGAGTGTGGTGTGGRFDA